MRLKGLDASADDFVSKPLAPLDRTGARAVVRLSRCRSLLEQRTRRVAVDVFARMMTADTTSLAIDTAVSAA